jgi:Uncharacterised BCR, YnfA/UPF0060 family
MVFVFKTTGLFIVTAIAEIVGCYLPYLWLKEPCLCVGFNTCRTEPRRFRLAPVPASRCSRSHVRGVWWRVRFGCARLALARRWAET